MVLRFHRLMCILCIILKGKIFPTLGMKKIGFDINVNFSASLYDYGKYTLNVRALDSEGRKSNDISYPFWFEESKFDWNGALIYMIMTDRFVNGNLSNDPFQSQMHLKVQIGTVGTLLV